ncbi:hypothetical protein B4109_3225 [Geobacillus stearothermophilus]|uniref:Uncharacterized protein n=1 Tax=Geobacillus stearothermophilus TaxID=1422 RepID=A0A150M8U1_GEOSE|nr:hypothetical protein B4109_3225 [Geobacillus stearothermophilus]
MFYATKGAANGVITVDAEREARRRYDKKRRESNYDIPNWWDLSFEEKETLIGEVKTEFEVIEYVLKRKK